MVEVNENKARGFKIPHGFLIGFALAIAVGAMFFVAMLNNNENPNSIIAILWIIFSGISFGMLTSLLSKRNSEQYKRIIGKYFLGLVLTFFIGVVSGGFGQDNIGPGIFLLLVVVGGVALAYLEFRSHKKLSHSDGIGISPEAAGKVSRTVSGFAKGILSIFFIGFLLLLALFSTDSATGDLSSLVAGLFFLGVAVAFVLGIFTKKEKKDKDSKNTNIP